MILSVGQGDSFVRLAEGLRRRGHLVDSEPDGATVLADWDRRSPAVELVLIETEPDGAAATSLCRELRARSDAGLVCIASQASMPQRLSAFDAGADDFITLPMDPGEIERRLRAVLARVRRGGPDRRRVLEGPSAITLQIDAHQAFVGRREVVLTSKQFSILQLLLERRGDVVTHGDLVNSIWGRGYSPQSHNFIEAHLSRIRRKLAAAGAPDPIETIRGLGYAIRS